MFRKSFFGFGYYFGFGYWDFGFLCRIQEIKSLLSEAVRVDFDIPLLFGPNALTPVRIFSNSPNSLWNYT